MSSWRGSSLNLPVVAGLASSWMGALWDFIVDDGIMDMVLAGDSGVDSILIIILAIV